MPDYNRCDAYFPQNFTAAVNLVNRPNKEVPLVSIPKCRILCVDHHHDTSEMLQALLSDADYEVQTASTIEEASRLASETQFDLYVLDKRLPDGTGLDLCQ